MKKIAFLGLLLSFIAAPAIAEGPLYTHAIDRNSYCDDFATKLATNAKQLFVPHPKETRQQIRSYFLNSEKYHQYEVNLVLAAIKPGINTFEDSKESVFNACIDHQLSLLYEKKTRKALNHN